MKCLRCGYCCIMYDVIILWPLDETLKKIKRCEDVPEKYFKHKPSGKQCPYLNKKDDGTYKCIVHDYPWYKYSPCDQHTQIGKFGDNCRIGEYMLQNNKLYNKIQDKEKIKDFEDECS